MQKKILMMVIMLLASPVLWSQAPEGFHDSFNLESLANWDQWGAPWSIESGSLAVSDDGQDSYFLKKGFVGGDLILESVFDILTSHQFSKGGLVFRVTPNPSSGRMNGYFAGLTPKNDKIFLSKLENGRETVLSEASIPETYYSGYLRVKAQGNRLRVYLNGDLKLDVRDDTYSSGRAGLRMYRARLVAGWAVAWENKDERQVTISGEAWNRLAFYSDLKKHYTELAQRGETFGPTDRLATNFSVLKDFVDQKIAGFSRPYDQAAVLYDWVINNLYYDRDAGSSPSGRVRAVDPMDVFSTPITNCNGYASLYATFLNLAGIPAIFAGGPTDQRGNKDYQGDHVWVEAYIDGRWRFMDPTFDSWNNFRGGEKQKRVNRNQWRYFDNSLAEFAQVHRTNRYFIQSAGAETPRGDLDSDSEVLARQRETPRGQTEWMIDQMLRREAPFRWLSASEDKELAVAFRGGEPGNPVFNETLGSDQGKWKLFKRGESDEGNSLVVIQHVQSNRFIELAGGVDRIGAYLQLAAPGAEGTVLELVVKDNGTLQVLSPKKGVIMRGGNGPDARLQRVSRYYDVLMTRFRFDLIE